MSDTLVYPSVLYFLLLFILSDVTMARHDPLSPRIVVGTSSAVEWKAQNFVTVKPREDQTTRQVFRRKEVKTCMPKAFRHSSGPSRYVNYRTTASSGCSTTPNSLFRTP
ncbi:hypothetical protein NMG60_11015657 [Bertholletia excelsa]